MLILKPPPTSLPKVGVFLKEKNEETGMNHLLVTFLNFSFGHQGVFRLPILWPGGPWLGDPLAHLAWTNNLSLYVNNETNKQQFYTSKTASSTAAILVIDHLHNSTAV